jgi:hypothetical protein
MVAAAIITTLGAVTAACIQSGFISKPPAVNMGPQTSPVVSFSGYTLPNAPAPVESFSGAHERGTYVPTTQSFSRPAPRIASAAFIGTIEPLREPAVESFRVYEPRSDSNLIAPRPFVPSDASQTMPAPSLLPSGQANTAAFLPSAADDGAKLTAGYAPALLREEKPVKILTSPWSFLSQSENGGPIVSDKPAANVQPTADDKSAGPAKAAKKSFDWGNVARLWPWHAS